MGYPNQAQQYNPYAQAQAPAYPVPPQQVNPYGPPAPQAPAAPQYANQGQQLAANNGLADPFANAGVGERIGGFKTGPNGHPVVNATLRNLGSGRIVIIVPKQLKRKQPNPFPEAAEKKPFRDELTADVIVCTGDPFKFGGNDKDIPDTLGPVPVPCVIPDAFITNDGVIEKVPEARVGKGIVVAHLVLAKTSKGNYAWNANEVPVDQYDTYGCRQAYQAYVDERLPKAEGEQPLKQVQSAAPAALPPAPIQQPVQAQYAQPVQQQPVPQWPQMPPGQTTAPMAPQMPVAPPMAPAAPAGHWTDNRAPAGYEGVWMTWTPEVRERVLSDMGVPNPNAAPPAPTGHPQQGAPQYAQQGAPTGY